MPSPRRHRRVKSLVREWDDLSVASKDTDPRPFPRTRAVSFSPGLKHPEQDSSASRSFSMSSKFPLSASTHSRRRSKDLTPLHIPDSPRSRIVSAPQTTTLSEPPPLSSHVEVLLPPLSPSPSLSSPAQDVYIPLSSPNSSTISFPSSGPPHSPSARSDYTDTSNSHSRVHSRNLSVYFPRPEQQSPYLSPSAQLHDVDENIADIPVPTTGSTLPRKGRHSLSPAGGGTSPRVNRRAGHHHRHSMSYSGFAFMDQMENLPGQKLTPTDISPNSFSPSSATISPSSTIMGAFQPPITVPSTLSLARTPHSLPSTTSLYQKYSHYSKPLRFFIGLGHLHILTQLALIISGLQIVSGVSLWISGQNSDFLSVTALGYWVVFDGIAALCSVIVEGNAGGVETISEIVNPKRNIAWSSPFGAHRKITLAHFSQCIFLLFSAIYILKETIEHALLMHNSGHESEHIPHIASGAISSEHSDSFHGVTVPVLKICLSIVTCVLTAVHVHNHASLTDATGKLALTLHNGAKGIHARFLEYLGNPFSLTIIGFGGILSIIGLAIPEMQLLGIDKIMAFMQSGMMFYLGYPAAIVTGKVLLQTAPSPDTDTMVSLKNAVEKLCGNPLVVDVSQSQVWQLSPYSLVKRRSSFGAEETNSIVVATLSVKVRNDATDGDIVDITRVAREYCAPAIEGVQGRRGEVSVHVKREYITQSQLEYQNGHMKAHDHAHMHDHDHDHDGVDQANGCSSHDHHHAHQHHYHSALGITTTACSPTVSIEHDSAPSSANNHYHRTSTSQSPFLLVPPM